MSEKIYVSSEGKLPSSQIGASLEALAHTIHARREAKGESYTYRLLTGDCDTLLKKVVEEAHETTLAAKDVLASPQDQALFDHVRYEAADVFYHLLVLLERLDIPLDEFAAELNSRMKPEELPEGGVLLKPEFINRGNHVE